MIVVALVAHPVDGWSLCGGTLTRLARETEVQLHVASLVGQSEQSESVAASQLIGASYHGLGRTSMRLFFNDETVELLTTFLRNLGAEILITHHPVDSNPDHQVVSQIVQAACLASACSTYETPSGAKPLAKIPHLYFCDPVQGVDLFGRTVSSGICVDVSHFVETKAELLAYYANRADEELEVGVLPSCSDRWLELSQTRGSTIGAQNAEGFTQCRGVAHVSEDILGELLGCWPADAL